jgi:sugar phosphate isomerase/epimerase
MLYRTKITGFADEINTDIEKQVQLLNELGISYLEFRSANGKNVTDFTMDEAKELKKYLMEHKLQVSAIGSPIGKIKITEDFESHFEVYKKVVEISKIMDTPYIRMFSFFIPERDNPEHYEEEVFSRMEQMVDYAKQQSVILLHENEKDIFGEKALQCLQLMKRFYGDHFKCTFDFANFVQAKQDTLEAYRLLQPYIEYIHIKDAIWENGKVVPAGEGDGNLREILTRIDQIGYSGFLSLEPHLFEFEGLRRLEKNPEKRPLADGEVAFTIAYQALINILG